jgi:hypothetical protein
MRENKTAYYKNSGHAVATHHCINLHVVYLDVRTTTFMYIGTLAGAVLKAGSLTYISPFTHSH